MTIATLGSHSALDICRGAKDEGLPNLVVVQKGRERTYREYYKACVDECLVLEDFSDIVRPEIQRILEQKRAIFIPHRSFEAYCNFDYRAIETAFRVPMFGNKYLLKFEERAAHPNQYDLLEAARVRFPVQFRKARDIDRLVIVKTSEKNRPWERAFFLASDEKSFLKTSQTMLQDGKITMLALATAVIEEYAVGVPVNFHFFYSALHKRLELVGTDARRQTNIDGLVRLPAPSQPDIPITFEEAGHMAVTVLESMLEEAFAIGERFVAATQKLVPPGIIGPFALQTIIVPGAARKEIVVVDVSPRMPGSPGISATPYSTYLYDHPVSMGRRIAMEIKEAMRHNTIDTITT